MEDISLRDYFAGKALQGLLANEGETLELFRTKKSKEDTLVYLANSVYQIADALIKERDKNAEEH